MLKRFHALYVGQIDLGAGPVRQRQRRVVADHGDPAEVGRQQAAQLTDWFGSQVAKWRFLRCYRISHALPGQPPDMLETIPGSVHIRNGLFICGDHRENATINGAMVSGRRAAEAVLQSESFKTG